MLLAVLLGLTAAGTSLAVPIPHDVDGTRLEVTLEPARSVLRVRARLQGHARLPTASLVLQLHPGFTVHAVASGWGPCEFVRAGDELRVMLPRLLEPGERYHLRIDYAGAFRDPRLAPGPSRAPLARAGGAAPLVGMGLHLGAGTGLVAPRESFWYPRPRHRDPQELDLWLTMPENWVLSARLFPEHDVPRPGDRRLHHLRSRGMVSHALGLAAGPYRIEERGFGAAAVRRLRYPRDLAEHPDAAPPWSTVEAVMATLGERFGEPGRGRLDLVQLTGSLPRQLPSSGLSQGAFAWIASPATELDHAGLAFLAGELSRFWWERGVQAAPPLRKALVAFSALLVLRHLRGEEAFLAGCRQAAARHDSKVLPGRRLLSPDPLAWEGRAAPPDPVDAGRNLVMVLMTMLQRRGEARLAEGMRAFLERHRGGRATRLELLDALERSGTVAAEGVDRAHAPAIGDRG